jgi:DNA polymerase
MSLTLSPELRQALSERIRFYQELGIYDFYRREGVSLAATTQPQNATPPVATPFVTTNDPMPRKSAAVAVPPALDERLSEVAARFREQSAADPAEALRIIREDLGDCTRCRLHKQGRKQIVFGVGNPHTDLMFIGEAPGADEDQQGEPFVGRAGQLLNNMIKAMGISREQVYIANIIKCRPPNNRTPERDECETCSPFLMRQVAAIKPRVIVALGAVAAKTLLAVNESMANLRGRWYEFRPTGVSLNDPDWTGAKLAVTYHPAFLLRDPRQKKEAWKDLQMVMKELGMPLLAKAVE